MPRESGKASPAGEAPAIRIDAANEWAWCGPRRLDLSPKEFALLRYLTENAGRLVTKDDLLANLWRDTVVSDAALTSCIRDLRRALEDSSRAPRYVETVHRRGFRFIGPIGAPILGTAAAVAPPPSPDGHLLVGRHAELARLEALFAAAAAGRRQVAFVTGEPGIGKTALVEAFLARLGGPGVRIGRGQCVENFGPGEPYLPLLEALGRLGRESRGDEVVRVLRQYAPTWLLQMPALLADAEVAAVERRAQGATRERMLREVTEAIDALARETPLALVLEDIHWCDSATIDVLARLARRPDAACLLVVGTYRPAEVASVAHPLKSVKEDLQRHGHCDEMPLGLLDLSAIDDYLGRRFPMAAFPESLARVLARSTSGSPLFLVSVIDDLLAHGRLRQVDGQWTLAVPPEALASTVPATLSQMVEQQVDRLTPQEQAVLTVASVAGVEFSAAVAVAGGIDPRDAEPCCDALVRRGQFLRAIGVAQWPDGTVAGRYAFVHALYQSVLYSRVPAGQRVGLHLRVGARLEEAHGARAAGIAGELAMHFEQGRDFERAVRYRQLAAEAALRRHSYRETVEHATRALQVLGEVPDWPAGAQHELAILMVLGPAQIARGWSAPEVARTYTRARELCGRVCGAPQSFSALIGLFGFHLTRGEVSGARDAADEMAAIAAKADDPTLRLAADTALGMTAFLAGEPGAALVHLERALAVYDPRQHSANRSPTFWGGHDVGVSAAVALPWVVWLLGYPDRAVARMDEALALARSIANPLSLAYACHFAAALHECRGDVDAVRELEEVASAHAAEHGFDLFSALGGVHRGWLRAGMGDGDGGAAEMRTALVPLLAGGQGFGLPTFLGLLAEGYGRMDRPDDGLSVLAETRAMVEHSGGHYWDAELRRLEGTLLLQRAPEEAEARFLEALEIARRQEARMLELRAATSLAHLWQRQKRTKEAAAILSQAAGWFTEGFETQELRAARALLGELSRGDGTAEVRPRARKPHTRAER